MKTYPRVFHVAAAYQNTCPTCLAPAGRHCISDTGKINTKTHAARNKDAEKHSPLPDLSAKWREWARYEGKHPDPRPANLEV